MIAQAFFINEQDNQDYADFVNQQLEMAAQQDHCDPDSEPLWQAETSDIPVLA